VRSTPEPGVAGIYASWDDVIARWIGQSKEALYYELGPPNLHAVQRTDKQTELVWDMTIDRMAGQADEYGLLSLTRFETCRLVLVARQDGVIASDNGSAVYDVHESKDPSCRT
jgi:hypothetical protein